jgi:hypothetical protein
MKQTIATIILTMLCLVAQAQFKVHKNGQISLQSATTQGGIQFDHEGRSSFEPNITGSGAYLSQTKVQSPLVKAWNVRCSANAVGSPKDRFYVTGLGDAYAHAHYTVTPGGGSGKIKGFRSINNASKLLSRLNGYYYDNNDFEGFKPDFVNNSNIASGAVEGMMKDLAIDKSLGLSVKDLEAVLPEAVRHDPEGMTYINYDALIPVLVEAFKEQQAKIEQLESILKKNGLLKP